MTIDEFLAIVRAEQLDLPVLPGGTRRPDAVALEVDEANGQPPRWRVSILSERAWPLDSTVRTFTSESDALEHALLKLRQSKTLRERIASRSERPRPEVGER
ncbi:hypothetical protein ACSDQ9_09140 [Aestuariimicrobium soli]|uniref:hypothetical protein n=1 Tax=Aestuariimicrobium soli TaxID=2035834 RepID=UPI003EBA12DF